MLATPPSIRQAVRSLVRQPAFFTIAVLSLALALALNTVMFAVFDGILHPDALYRAPERLFQVVLQGGGKRPPVTLDMRYDAIRDATAADGTIASFSYLPVAIETLGAGRAGSAAAVDDRLFALLGVAPERGRSLGSEARPEALVSHRFWNAALHGAPLAGLPPVTIGNREYTVVGVMPRGVHFPFDADAWISNASAVADPSLRRFGPLAMVRLHDGVSAKRLESDAGVAASRLGERHPERALSARIVALDRTPAAATIPQLGVPLTLVVGIVLAIACANLATLMLARGMARRHETALRVALGATRRDVVAHVLVECAIVVGAGAAIGLVLTAWALAALPHFATPSVAMLGDVAPTPRWRVFAYVGVVAAALVALAGLLPALGAARVDPAEPLKDGGTASTARRRDRYNPLIMAEVALSTALLMCCALFVQQSLRLAQYEFRYAAKRTVTADVVAPTAASAGPGASAAVARFYDGVLSASAALPRARFAATQHQTFVIGPAVWGESGSAGARWMNLRSYAVVSPDYMRTLGLSIVRGRDFAPGDAAGPAPVVIVDEEAAQRLWPDVDPVGRMIRLGGDAQRVQPWLRVVGVVHAPDLAPWRRDDVTHDPNVYVVVPGDTTTSRALLVQGDGRDGSAGRAALMVSLGRTLRDAGLRGTDARVRPWFAWYESLVAMTGFFSAVLAAFGAFGLVLCAVGLYGVLSYTVSRRLREYAVRVALGASRRDVARLVVHDAAVIALAGVGVGAFVALWLTRPFADVSLPYADALALVAAETVLFAVASVACAVPLRRAMRADPVSVLRSS